jgi:PHD/YefM family antitoxin component YafN of YafNO toxin-antitoxin module
MESVNALKIRQAFGSVLKRLRKTNEPILIEKGREPVAVLISLETFQKRFIDYRDREKRDRLLLLARESATEPKTDSMTVLRELRNGPNH